MQRPGVWRRINEIRRLNPGISVIDAVFLEELVAALHAADDHDPGDEDRS